MKVYSCLLLIIFYLASTALEGIDKADGIQLHKSSVDKAEGSQKETEGKDLKEDQTAQLDSGDEESDNSKKAKEIDAPKKTEESSESETVGVKEGGMAENSEMKDGPGKEGRESSSEGEMAEESVPDSQSKDIVKEEDEKNELKKLEEFKKSETLEKEPGFGEKEASESRSEGEKKYQVESEVVSEKNVNVSDVKMTDENEFTVDHPTVNQVVNKVIQPSTDEKQLQVEMKDDFESESGMEESKQTKSVLLTFDLASEYLSGKISLISDSRLTLTRYIGMAPQKAKITIVDPTVQLSSSQTRLSELSRYESIEFELSQKVPGKSDIVSLSEISNHIPIILQQHNTTVLRFLLEAANSQTQFGLLSNMDGVGPTLVLELKPTVESNSTWMYTITGVAIIVVIIGVSIALYFQNKNKESQKIENLPLLNKV